MTSTIPRPGPTLFTKAEAARILRVSASTMGRLIRRRRILAYRVGSAIRIPADELTRIIEEGVDP